MYILATTSARFSVYHPFGVQRIVATLLVLLYFWYLVYPILVLHDFCITNETKYTKRQVDSGDDLGLTLGSQRGCLGGRH